MKKLNFGEFDGLEKIGGGIFGVIAIGAAIAEMIFLGIESASIAGCIKDVASTLIVVMVLITALKRIFPKQGFEETFEEEMKSVIKRYNPVIVKGKDINNAKTVRNYIYNIAADINCFIGENPKNYTTEFFYINEEASTITFKVRKTVFFGSSKDEKNEELGKILDRVTKCVMARFGNTNISHSEKKELDISFYYIQQATPKDTAKMLTSIVDYVILLYIAENKK